MTEIVTAICLSALAMGTVLIWRSRWNVPGFYAAGFVLSAVLLPIFFYQVMDDFPGVTGLYLRILTIGTSAFMAGLFLGARLLRSRRYSPFGLTFNSLPDSLFTPLIVRRVTFVLVIGLVLLLACFAGMGFVAILADDPYQAKFFRGPYYEPYRDLAIPYRTAFHALAAAIPVGLAGWYVTKKLSLLILSAAAVIALTATLSRATALFGLLLFLGLFAAKKRSVPLYVLFVVLAFPLGAALYYIIGTLGGSEAFLSLTRNAFKAITVQDVSDHLLFLREFAIHGELTEGRTFWGGLIPWHYRWNPAVWTLSVVSPGVPVTEITSGGLRLPVPIWGYVSFGWPGVVAVSALSGVLWGATTRLASRYVGEGSLLRSVVPLTLYVTLGFQLAMFYFLSIHNIPGILVALYFSLRLVSKADLDRVRSIPNELPALHWRRTEGFW